MTVRRVVANIATDRVAGAKAFYGDVLDMRITMDFGWIVTFAEEGSATPQVSVASEGGSGTLAIEYGPVAEPWGVRRFYVRDPFGRLVNILSHTA